MQTEASHLHTNLLFNNTPPARQHAIKAMTS